MSVFVLISSLLIFPIADPSSCPALASIRNSVSFLIGTLFSSLCSPLEYDDAAEPEGGREGEKEVHAVVESVADEEEEEEDKGRIRVVEREGGRVNGDRDVERRTVHGAVSLSLSLSLSISLDSRGLPLELALMGKGE